MIGEARVTSIFACSLSNVTVRGVEITLASAYLFRNESTALTPSALRNAIAGLKAEPLARLISNIGLLRMPPKVPGFAGVVTGPFAVLTVVAGVAGVPGSALLPKVKCWAARVPDQSTPLLVLGLVEVSSKRASIST